MMCLHVHQTSLLMVVFVSHLDDKVFACWWVSCTIRFQGSLWIIKKKRPFTVNTCYVTCNSWYSQSLNSCFRSYTVLGFRNTWTRILVRHVRSGMVLSTSEPQLLHPKNGHKCLDVKACYYLGRHRERFILRSWLMQWWECCKFKICRMGARLKT